MVRWRVWLVLALVAGVGAVAAWRLLRHGAGLESARAAVQVSASSGQARASLFSELQPIRLANCELQRFGEPHDGGYLMCANLLGSVQSGYSYGISGYDQWGCDISHRLSVPVHQYDCFNLQRPACPGGRTLFHEECVAGEPARIEGRLFDTLEHQFAKNGDAARRLVVKMDVEGAEWETFLRAPDDLFDRIDQLVVEFHGARQERCLAVVRKLKQFFYVANLHFNNYSCQSGLEPFPTWAYEALFVSKRVGVPDPSGASAGRSDLDAPNDPLKPDCQAHR